MSCLLHRECCGLKPEGPELICSRNALHKNENYIILRHFFIVTLHAARGTGGFCICGNDLDI